MSGKWFTVPTRDETNQRKLEARNAKRAAARGEEYDEETVEVSRRERERARERERLEEARERQAAEDKKRDAKLAREKAIAEAKEAAQRKAEAQARQRQSRDPSTWPTVLDAVDAAESSLTAALDKLLDDPEDAMLDQNPALRFEYLLATVDSAVPQVSMPKPRSKATWRPSLEPATSFLEKFPASSKLRVALQRHFDYEKPTATELLQVCAVLFGAKGNAVVRVEKGEKIGALLALQLILRTFADVIADNLDAFTTFFFAGAAGDKSSAAFVNLNLILDNITVEASNGALRNAVVSVANNADKLGISGTLLGLLAPWFAEALKVVRQDCQDDASTRQPLRLDAGAANLLLSTLEPSVATPLIIACGVLWHPNSGPNVIAPLLKSVKAIDDAFATCVAAMIEVSPALSSQLAVSVASSTNQVNAVLETLRRKSVPLPKTVAADITANATAAQAKDGGKGRAGLEAVSRLAGSVKTTTESRASPPAKGSGLAASKTKAPASSSSSSWLLPAALFLVVAVGIGFYAPHIPKELMADPKAFWLKHTGGARR